MKICGIVSEYNPFHNGHAYHVQKTRQLLGADTAILAVMSGNYVQRGDFAIVEKYQRAAMAVQNGVDLVIELPLSAALSSAQDFALGAVGTLDRLGCVTHLSFGSECGDISRLRAAAQADRSLLRAYLSEGLSYAAALQRAVSDKDPDAGSLLSHPNNTLGIEYCAALDQIGSSIEPVTILRDGAAHDSEEAHLRPSASFLRTLIAQGQTEACQNFMPDSAFSILSHACQSGHAPVCACDAALVSYLRRFSAAALIPYAGDTDGLHHRLYAAISENTSFDAICRAAQTRRYPLSRIRRTLLRTYLGLPQALDPLPHYIRVLAIGVQGRALLRRIARESTLPLITKPISEKRLPKEFQSYLEQDRLADELYTLAKPDATLHTAGARYRQTPYLYTKETDPHETFRTGQP